MNAREAHAFSMHKHLQSCICIHKNCVWNNQELVLGRKTKAAVGKQFSFAVMIHDLFLQAAGMRATWSSVDLHFSEHFRSGRKYLKMSLRYLSPGRATKCENRIGNRARRRVCLRLLSFSRDRLPTSIRSRTLILEHDVRWPPDSRSWSRYQKIICAPEREYPSSENSASVCFPSAALWSFLEFQRTLSQWNF